MKKLTHIFPLLVLVVSCTKDHGNYEYKEINAVQITAEESDFMLNMLDTLVINPILEGSMEEIGDDSGYEFLWTIYTTTSYHADTISRERNLVYLINKVPGNYRISFRVKPLATGVSYRYQFNLTVMTELQRGFLALSEVDGKANVTFVNVMGNVYEDIFYNINGQHAGTNPVAIRWTMEAPNDYIAIICDDERGGVYASGLSFTHMFDYADWFYEGLDVIKPQAYHVYSNQSFIVNNNKLHYRDRNYNLIIDGQSVRVESKFYAAYPGNYEASPVYVRNNIHYCSKNQRFLYIPAPTQPNIFSTAADPDNPIFDPANVGLDLVYAKMTRAPRGILDMDAIFENEDGTRYYLKYNINNPSAIVPIKKEVLPSAYHINHATSFAGNHDEDFFYYGSGNKVYVYDPLINEERTVYEFDPQYQVDNVMWHVYEPADRQLFVCISQPGMGGKNGSIYHMNVASNGNLSIRHAYMNVCGRVISTSYKN